MNHLRNNVQLLGHLGQDPEFLQLEDGKKCAKFPLATHELYTNAQGEQVEKTYWHRIVFWNRSAEIIEQHVKKGTRLLIQGKLTSTSWEDDHGVKHYRNEVVGRHFMIL